ncbi:MAG: tetratricopeptide repeat protein [Bacteroidota bacterium]
MKRLFFVLSFLSGSSFWLSAQESLYEKANALLDEGYYDSALVMANSIVEDTSSYELLRLKADLHLLLFNYQKALSYYQKSILIAEETPNFSPESLSESYTLQGETYFSMSLFDQSIASSRKALNYAKMTEDKMDDANAMYNMSTSFTRKGVFDSAIYYIELVYEIDLEIGDSTNISSDFNTLGFLHIENGEFQKGLDYYEQSYSYLSEKDSYQKGVRISNMAFAKMKLGRTSEATGDFNKAVDFFQSIGATKQVIKQYLNLGSMMTGTKSFDQAVEYFERALELSEGVNDEYIRMRIMIQLSNCFVNLDQMVEAEDYLTESIEIAEDFGLLEDLVRCYELRSIMHEKSGNRIRAYNSLKEYIFFKDSLDKTNRLSEIHDLELAFVSKQKEKEIQVLALQNQVADQELSRKKRNNVLLICGLAVAITVALVIFSLQRQKIRLQQTVYSKEIDELKIQIKTLIGKYEGSLEVSLEELNQKLVNPLSEREYDVFKQIFSQKTNSEIAEELFVSINTVKTHLKNLYHKLGVSNRKEALGVALK